MKRIAIALLLVMAAIVVPASAIIIPADDVNSYSYTTDKGYVIYKIDIDNLPIGSNQSHVLYYGGYPYYLTVETWAEWGLWKNARVTFTMPNGTVQTATASASTVVGNYKTTIQPTFRADSSQLTSGTPVFLKVDLNIGLTPTSAQFSTQPMGYNPETSIPFKSASGEFTNFGTSDVYLYVITEKEFTDTVTTYNPTAGLDDLGSTVFQWTWSAVIGFLNMIPVIGPYMVTFIDYAAIAIGFLTFWVGFMIFNSPAIVLAAEELIMAFAAINAPSGPRGFGAIFKNLYNYNRSLVEAFVGGFNALRDMITAIINLVTSVVNALKPV